MYSLIGGRKRRSHFFYDRKRRSSEGWERGRGARRKGNPNYKPVKRRTKSGLKKVYVLRKKSKKSHKKTSHKRYRKRSSSHKRRRH